MGNSHAGDRDRLTLCRGADAAGYFIDFRPSPRAASSRGEGLNAR